MHPAIVIGGAAVCGAGMGAASVPLINRHMKKLQSKPLSTASSVVSIVCVSLLWAATFAVRGMSLDSLILALAAVALYSLSRIDWSTYEIPFVYNVILFGLGLVRLALDLPHWYEYVIGFFAVSLPLAALFYLSRGRAVGGGDVKLMAACGLLLGWKLVLLGFVLGCIVGSVVHILRMKISGEKHVLAMGPYLSIGVFASALFGDALIAWYLSLLGI